jgi:hypothetical protein
MKQSIQCIWFHKPTDSLFWDSALQLLPIPARSGTRYFLTVTLALALLLALTVVPAAAVTEAYIGDTIPLSGFSYGSPTVYLFLTGPNLPANGVALDNIDARADQGSFTRVDVDSDQRWSYRWATHALGGRIDVGAYTVWVVNAPVDLSHLSGHEYSTLPLLLKRPGLAVETTPPAGAVFFRSTPSNAGIFLNAEYRGMTPLRIDGIPPGTYTITFSRFGYGNVTTGVVVEAGGMNAVNVTLVPLTGAIAVNTSPAGARIVLDGADAGVSPATITNVTLDNHTVLITKQEYLPAEQTVDLTRSGIARVEVTLSPVATPTAGAHVLPVLLAVALAVLLFAVCPLCRRRG